MSYRSLDTTFYAPDTSRYNEAHLLHGLLTEAVREWLDDTDKWDELQEQSEPGDWLMGELLSDGGLEIQRYNGSRLSFDSDAYYDSRDTARAIEAFAFCQQVGSYLAIIDDEDFEVFRYVVIEGSDGRKTIEYESGQVQARFPNGDTVDLE